ncbi:hypothetical protein BDN72DRAFT_882632 [Pluteus cervinus]|uniref:Uncharacterized protein n=1 Tax=Pluteus cervinus TaxID=181527 RepID=A0ACD3A9B6_9AGAR|nr:hypothetical protein BDN72DRAFT_882632 [Pluteus cervinus]
MGGSGFIPPVSLLAVTLDELQSSFWRTFSTPKKSPSATLLCIFAEPEQGSPLPSTATKLPTVVPFKDNDTVSICSSIRPLDNQKVSESNMLSPGDSPAVTSSMTEGCVHPQSSVEEPAASEPARQPPQEPEQPVIQIQPLPVEPEQPRIFDSISTPTFPSAPQKIQTFLCRPRPLEHHHSQNILRRFNSSHHITTSRHTKFFTSRFYICRSTCPTIPYTRAVVKHSTGPSTCNNNIFEQVYPRNTVVREVEGLPRAYRSRNAYIKVTLDGLLLPIHQLLRLRTLLNSVRQPIQTLQHPHPLLNPPIPTLRVLLVENPQLHGKPVEPPTAASNVHSDPEIKNISLAISSSEGGPSSMQAGSSQHQGYGWYSPWAGRVGPGQGAGVTAEPTITPTASIDPSMVALTQEGLNPVALTIETNRSGWAFSSRALVVKSIAPKGGVPRGENGMETTNKDSSVPITRVVVFLMLAASYSSISISCLLSMHKFNLTIEAVLRSK